MPPPSLLHAPGAAAAPGAPSSADRRTPVPSWAVDLRLTELADGLGPGEVGVARLALLLTPLPTVAAVRERQAIFRDLEEPLVGGAFRELAATLDRVTTLTSRAARMRHPAERDRWLLEAMADHDAAVTALAAALSTAGVQSTGVAAVRDHVAGLVASPGFVRRQADAADALAGLARVRVRLRIEEQRVVVSPVRDEPDLAAAVGDLFARFRDGGATPLRVDAFDTLDMNPVEAEVLSRVVRLDPGPFSALAAAVAAHRPVVDPWIASLAWEASWFLAVLDLLEPLRRVGTGGAYPSVSEDGRLEAAGLVDLALARQRAAAGRPTAASDLAVRADERLVVITGPGQSGRTSFARALGQLHVLAAAGCPVNARVATVPLVDVVHAVFDRPERLDDPGGRLRGELRMIRAQLRATTPASLVVANEPFASTTAEDAVGLARRWLAAVRGRGARAVVVTFLDELADDPAAVSLAAVDDPDDPAARTFRFERGPAAGLAHAQSLAARHGLGAGDVAARLRR